ncbi:uncharacterized protein At4g00950 [Lycium ferocissimum]|uniref:uncharacterized protein At4g00950 n=1 Tax=Lycium ferocissimum TaxID=112874 RepID=UPI002815448A|nr:uncharacterized protein At4g00950 [Lycium ferocissimum]
MASHNHEDFETCTNSYSTPKLSLSKLPNKPIRNNNHHLAAYTTPPLHPLVSIPFQWEEAPGKPKSPTKSKVARCLDLPPRLLLSEAMKITNTPSPTTVLNGPYVGRSFSSINEAALEKKDISGNNKDMLMRSCRWESFKENNRGVAVKGSFDFSCPLSSTASSTYDFDTHQRKVLRFTRKGSFFSFSRNNSNLLGGIYDSIKQAVPWRWRRAKSKRAL